MSAGTDEIGETLQRTLTLLQALFPDAQVREVSLNVCVGERGDHNDPQDWVKVWWRVQINNDSGNGPSLNEALAELRERIDQHGRVRENAVRLAALMREIPQDRFERGATIEAANQILEDERRRRSE